MTRVPEPNFICDLSGKKYPRSQMRMMWNGLYVHKSEWEPRQPQDFTNPVRAPRPLQNARPDSDPVVNWSQYAGILLDSSGLPILDSGGLLILT